MFGRKRRGSSNPPPLVGSNVNPNAATAAAQAFLSSKSSGASLASAAAGAALRSRPTTPTSVADVQTKRTLRRHASNSSVGSNVAGVSHPTLERKNSSGSMSERTFRDQSPGRGSIREATPDVPPVPAIPQNLKPAIPPKSHRRSASLEAAPGRLASPPPNKTNGRGSSMGPIGGHAAAPRRGGQRGSSLSSVQELTGTERPASRGNRRPISLQAAQITQNGTNLVYDPNTRSFRPATEVYIYDEPIQEEEEEERPTRKKKTVQPKGTASGSQIADGTHFGGPRGTAVDAINAATSRKHTEPTLESRTMTPEPVFQPPVAVEPSTADPVPAEISLPTMTEPKKKKKKRVADMNESGSEQGYTSNMSSASDNDSDVPARPRKPKDRPTGLQKRPSIVRELPEDEESDSQTTSQISRNVLGTDSPDAIAIGVSPTPLPRPNGAKGHGKASASAAYAEQRSHTRSASQPPMSIGTPASSTESNGSAVGNAIGRGKGSVRGNRTVSVSPARTTRFAADTEKPANLTVMHQPPGRSISPRKSALKNSNSPRGPSPAQAQTSSDLSDNSTTHEERPPRKKKTARVSFDETNTVVGTAAPSVPSEASTLPSPQTKDKRTWFGLKNKGIKTIQIGGDEEEELMTPRPVLPSFGSVRERKIREPTEERPLVIPSDAQHVSEPAASLSRGSPSPTENALMGVSNDHAVGSVLAQDAASKNEANTSKLLEPLPPLVTSVEGTGYSSDSSAYDSAREKRAQNAVSEQDNLRNASMNTSAERPGTLASLDSDHLVFEDAENKDSPIEGPNLEVPEIAVTHSTPTLEETEKQKEWTVPGGFPSASSDSETFSDSETIVPNVPSETPASVGIAEPPAESVHLGSTGVPIENAQHHPVSAVTEDSDHDSVYDDAAEDLSDGDGFLSLNAVASSPVKTLFKDTTPGLAISTPPDSPVDRSIKEKAFRIAKKQQKGGNEPDMGEGWEKAQQYWAGLTADKKRELEQAARDEAETSEEEDEDEEEEQVPEPSKPKIKKRVVVASRPLDSSPQPASPHRTYQITPGTKAAHNGLPTMRSSMRATLPVNDNTTHMRKSMRNGRSNNGSMRESSDMSSPMESKAALQTKNRPISYSAPLAQPDPVAVQKQLRQMSAATTPVNGRKKPVVAPQLKRTNSTESDSSFKRTRPMAHSMRGSMRNSGSIDRTERTPRPYSPDVDTTRSSRFSIRSLSPTGSTFRRPFAGGPPVSLGQGTMRGSMRSSSNGPPKNSLISGFGRSTPKTKPKSKSTVLPTSRSRFADSSDEEDARPAFSSRFVDSSDDDDDERAPLPGRTMRNSTLRPPPAQSAASAATPKRKPPVLNDGDSSDLPDSDDEAQDTTNFGSSRPTQQQQQTASTAAPTSLRRSGSGREYNPSSSGLRDPQKQQRGFLNILRRKKDPGSKVRKVEIESAARRDTPLERTRGELLGVRKNSSNGVLQKRNSASRTNSSSAAWPLTPSLPRDANDNRPATADAAGMAVGNGTIGGGGASSSRPPIHGRRNTATGLLGVDAAGGNSNVVLGKSGKPKRFMGLRRVLGIKD